MPYAAPASAPCSFALSEVMNLIVGVLVEVVGVVAAAEQEASTRNAIFEALQEARTGFFPLHRTVACDPSECLPERRWNDLDRGRRRTSSQGANLRLW